MEFSPLIGSENLHEVRSVNINIILHYAVDAVRRSSLQHVQDSYFQNTKNHPLCMLNVDRIIQCKCQSIQYHVAYNPSMYRCIFPSSMLKTACQFYTFILNHGRGHFDMSDHNSSMIGKILQLSIGIPS